MAGGLLGLPTETVYGLAADADNDIAVAQIFTAKGRPADHPLIVHVADAVGVAHFARHVPDFAMRLMDAFWPGPLTLILPRRLHVACAAAGGHATIGLRCPSHPVARALLLALQAGVWMGASMDNFTSSASAAHAPTTGILHRVWGLAAPSANRFGGVSPTTAQHVQHEFTHHTGLLILDGGPCSVGIESSIIDCTRRQPVLLRPGSVTLQQVQDVCGLPVLLPGHPLASAAPAPQAPGTLAAHYAPRAQVCLMDPAALQAACAERPPTSVRPDVAVWSRGDVNIHHATILHQVMPNDARAAAQRLFAVLRDFDAQGVGQIWIENVPDGPEWDGVRDRLLRASAKIDAKKNGSTRQGTTA